MAGDEIDRICIVHRATALSADHEMKVKHEEDANLISVEQAQTATVFYFMVSQAEGVRFVGFRSIATGAAPKREALYRDQIEAEVAAGRFASEKGWIDRR